MVQFCLFAIDTIDKKCWDVARYIVSTLFEIECLTCKFQVSYTISWHVGLVGDNLSLITEQDLASLTEAEAKGRSTEEVPIASLIERGFEKRFSIVVQEIGICDTLFSQDELVFHDIVLCALTDVQVRDKVLLSEAFDREPVIIKSIGFAYR